MTIENTGGAWLVLLDGRDMESLGGEDGTRLAESAARLTGCVGDCSAQVYYGRGEALLFLQEREPPALFHFGDLEELLPAARLCRDREDSALYAAERGYILSLGPGDPLPLGLWDLGRPLPYGAAGDARPLIAHGAAPMLCRVFAL